MKAAKQRFDSDEIADNSKSTTPFTGFQTAKGGTVKISNEALKAAKQRFDSDEIANNNNKEATTPFTGFQRTKAVEISNDVLQNSKPNEEYCLIKPMVPWVNHLESMSIIL